tara:strand:+ start:139 stop:429 length:291 start_codon:yes stop_codon:yes gene_type:complete
MELVPSDHGVFSNIRYSPSPSETNRLFANGGTDPLNAESDCGDEEELYVVVEGLEEGDEMAGKYGGAGCSTASGSSLSWTWLIGLVGLLSFRRKRK